MGSEAANASSRPLRCSGNFARASALMANRAIWNVRMRHEWLSTPLKGKRLSKRKRARVGIEQARERRAESSTEPTPES